METKKKCSRCKKMKSVSEFCKHKKTKDGLGAYCRECRKTINAGYKETYRQRRLSGNSKKNDKSKELVRDTALVKWVRDCNKCEVVKICKYRASIGMWLLCEIPDNSDIERMKDKELIPNKIYPKELLCQENLLMFA